MRETIRDPETGTLCHMEDGKLIPVELPIETSKDAAKPESPTVDKNPKGKS